MGLSERQCRLSCCGVRRTSFVRIHVRRSVCVCVCVCVYACAFVCCHSQRMFVVSCYVFEIGLCTA